MSQTHLVNLNANLCPQCVDPFNTQTFARLEPLKGTFRILGPVVHALIKMMTIRHGKAFLNPNNQCRFCLYKVSALSDFYHISSTVLTFVWRAQQANNLLPR